MLTCENTWKDIDDSKIKVAIVPIGSTEQHGTNLPLASDSLITAKVAEALAKGLQAYLVPLMPIGTSTEHMSFCGTITFTSETLKAVISDIVESLVKTGFETIIVLSLHGGNYILWSDFIPELDKKHAKAKIFRAELQNAWDKAEKAAGFDTSGMHAHECEASLIASLCPELVGPDPVDFPNPRKRLDSVQLDHTGFPLDVRELSPCGALGEPSKGNKKKGDRFWPVFLKQAVIDVKKQSL